MIKSPSFSTIALNYAKEVVSGDRLAGAEVVMACNRHINDLAAAKLPGALWKFDKKKANRVCAFVELCPHIKGKWAKGKTRQDTLIKLEPWQIFMLCCVFGWVDYDELRKYRTVYIEVPRKNAKSTLTAPVALYMLCCDGEEGAEIYTAATSRDQARIVFDVAKQMAAKMPDFCEYYGIDILTNNLSVKSTSSLFMPLSAEASTLDGKNPHFSCIDELHAHKNRTVFDVLETATGARTQPLLWLITTAGVDISGICYEQRDYVTKILKGTIEDHTYFGIIYTVPEDSDWADPKVWETANPNYGVSVFADDIARLCKKAQAQAAAVNNFLTKRLNIWCNSGAPWMDMVAWNKLADPTLQDRYSEFVNDDSVIALDLARKLDITANIHLVSRVIEGKPHYYLFSKFYLPHNQIMKDKNSQFAGWERDDVLVGTPGDIVDYDIIRDDVLEIANKFTVKEVIYDPWHATGPTNQLKAEGILCVELRGIVQNFSEPMKEVEALVVDGRLHHTGCPMMSWMMGNVTCQLDLKENIFPRKAGNMQKNKIDGPVALIMAINRLQVEIEVPFNPWDSDPNYSMGVQIVDD